jgi:hypothetical protein
MNVQVGEPTWMRDPKRVQTIMGVYDAYIGGKKPLIIAAEQNISLRTVHSYIKLAREYALYCFQGDIFSSLMEAVDKRERTIADLRAMLIVSQATKPSAKRQLVETRIIHEIGVQQRAIEELIGLRGQSSTTRNFVEPEPNMLPNKNLVVIGPDGQIEDDGAGSTDDQI